MSIVEELGALVRATADDLPLAPLIQALERLGQASERLRWVRQESADPMGVPELSAATEHAETAGHLLRVAQDQLAAYLAAIGLSGDGPPAAPGERPAPKYDAPVAGPAPEPEARGAVPVRRWWSIRVAELTGGRDVPDTKPDEELTDPTELLRRVADQVRSDDRGQLHVQLRDVNANVGLGLAAVAPPMLRDLAAELLGHPPRAQDLPRLRDEVTGKVRDLLPGLPQEVLDTLLSRICRMPPPKTPAAPPHPADPAVAAGVVTGLLLGRLGHNPRSMAAQSLRESDG